MNDLIAALGRAFTGPALFWTVACSAVACGSGGGGEAPAEDIGGAVPDVEDDAGSTDGGADSSADASACPAFCDDQLDCTTDRCEDGECVFEVTAAFCLLDGACRASGELHPTDPCLTCAPELSSTAWSPVAEPVPCDDGSACTLDDVCAAAGCQGTAVVCNDDNPCTDDTCTAADGQCVFSPNNAPCDDGNPCTSGEACAGGACSGGGPQCDDGDACTADACDAGACSAVPVDCDDGNPCTADSCDAVSGCTSSPQSGAPCEAGNFCLSGDQCANGTCVEGATAAVCPADDNACTDAVCVPTAGCVQVNTGSACDDGFACTESDTCVAGVCIGVATDACTCEEPASFGDFQKAKVLLVGGNGEPGAGLDVDDDPTTCAPQPGCSAGIDNALADLSEFLNPALTEAIETGSWVTLVELVGPKSDGSFFGLRVYGGLLDKLSNPFCNVQEATCDYVILEESLSPDCKASISVDDAYINDGVLYAGGPGSVFAVDLPLSPDKNTKLIVMNGRVEAKVTFGEGGTIAKLEGIVGGAVPKQVVFDIVADLDPSLTGGLTNEQLLQLVDAVLVEDVDLDGDGIPDAASLGLRIETIPGNVTGLQ
jgi:hypothetical protein